jgi:Mg2+-importing ATPase
MGIRVIGLATREFQKKAVYKKADERELVFEGFLLLNDPPLADARQTIADLREHGVDVKVITGDNRYVTQAMAVAVGLTTPKALTGFEIQSMSESELAAAVEAHQLFAEVDPQQKHQIVAALKKQGHIVGYMGDGINDAPALKEADVGISVENAVDVA